MNRYRIEGKLSGAWLEDNDYFTICVLQVFITALVFSSDA